ncbi:MAG: carbohydrate-binding protein [Segetibacter sp.]
MFIRKREKWVEASASSGKKWIVANDEQNPASIGVAADAEYTGNRGSVADNSEQIRKAVLWGNLMAGGAGVEYYFGYKTGETDLTCQDFRSRAKSWRYAKYALEFFKTYLTSTQLKPMNNVSSGWCLGKDSLVYVVYLKRGGSSNITLPAGSYTVKWYNPRAGGGLQIGSVTSVASGTVSIGNPPSNVTSDWVVLIKNTGIPPSDNRYQAENYTAESGTTVSSLHKGYTGTGYADYGGNGTWIEWNNILKSSGTVTLIFYYANGSAGNGPCSIIVNGASVGNISFVKTGSWTTWQ